MQHLLITAIFTGFSLSSMSQCDSVDLILDPSFEAGEYLFDCQWSGNPLECGWENYDGGQFIQSAGIDGSVIYCSVQGGAHQYIDVLPNTTYTIRCWVRSNSDVFQMGVDTYSNSWTLSNDIWQEASITFTSGTDSLTKDVWFYSANTCVDAFMMCYEGTLSSEELTFKSTLTPYPNPTDGAITFDLSSLADHSSVCVSAYTIAGDLIYHDNHIQSDTYELVLDRTSGVYLVEVGSEGEVERFRVVVQ